MGDNSENEGLRSKKPVNAPKRKLVPAGASAKKAAAAPKKNNAAKTKKKTKANVHKEFSNAAGRELTAADKKIVDLLNAYTETLGENGARAKVLEKLGAAHAERSGKDKGKAFRAALEKLVGRKLTAADLELVKEDLNNEGEIAALAMKIRYRPFKKAIGHSPTANEIERIQAYQGSEERKAAKNNNAKAMNKAFIAKLKAKSAVAGEEPKITAAMIKARTARLKKTKEETDAFDAKVAGLKAAAKEELMAARSKKTEPTAKDINALARIRAHGMILKADHYLLIQYDQDSEDAAEVIVDLQGQAEGIDVCAQCEVENLLKHI